ncbi:MULTISPECIES: glycosyltransferase [unclassified Rhizobium]|uniref:glycosyltransferase family 2 protein n=1 Tax=unclassified Rhizobium TaxID=2613769 RepID=UPI00288ABDC4|nr:MULTISPECIES: glycosyltransferase [unclassified Rhizobium]
MTQKLKSHMALISVVLPVYNAVKFLRATLDGIARQQYPSIEVVIVDDGSTDASRDIYNQWIEENPGIQVTVIENALNLGVCNALRTACDCASGSYIAQIGHDDVWLPTHLESLAEALDSSKAVAAFGEVKYIDENDTQLDLKIFDHSLVRSNDRADLFARLFSGNMLCAPASLFRKEAFETRFWGLHNERLQDYQLWLSLLLVGKFTAVEEVTMLYRVHGSNLSAGNTLLLQSQFELFEVQQKILTSERLFDWLREIASDEMIFDNFINKLNQNIVKVANYYPPLQLNFLVFLERLQEEFPANWSVRRLRVNFLSRMGVMRKALLISKVDPSLGPCGKEGAPILVPANTRADNQSFQFLIETGWFTDGRGVDLVSRGISDFFFFVDEDDLESSLSHAQFYQAHEKRRVYVFSNQVDVTLGSVCRVPSEYRFIGHQELDKMLRWAEDARMLG